MFWEILDLFSCKPVSLSPPAWLPWKPSICLCNWSHENEFTSKNYNTIRNENCRIDGVQALEPPQTLQWLSMVQYRTRLSPTKRQYTLTSEIQPRTKCLVRVTSEWILGSKLHSIHTRNHETCFNFHEKPDVTSLIVSTQTKNSYATTKVVNSTTKSDTTSWVTQIFSTPGMD